jgi:excisionase family DNA binding protein
MKPREPQFDLRKNPDSPRVHGLRIAVSAPPHAQQNEFQNAGETRPANAGRPSETFELPLSHAPAGATGGERKDAASLLTVKEVAAMLHVPVSWVYGRMRKRSLERLPAYRLGKYWRFREEDILQWLGHRSK